MSLAVKCSQCCSLHSPARRRCATREVVATGAGSGGESEQIESSMQALVSFDSALSWSELKAQHAALLSSMVGSGEDTQQRFLCGAFAQLDDSSGYDALNEQTIGAIAANAFAGNLAETFQVADLFCRCLAERLLEKAGVNISSDGRTAVQRAFDGLRSLPPATTAVQERATATVAAAVLESLFEEHDFTLTMLADSEDADPRVVGEARAMVDTIDELLQQVPQPDPAELEPSKQQMSEQ